MIVVVEEGEGLSTHFFKLMTFINLINEFDLFLLVFFFFCVCECVCVSVCVCVCVCVNKHRSCGTKLLLQPQFMHQMSRF